MTNRVLTDEERKAAMDLVANIEARIRALAGADEELAFAFTRKVSKELVYLERDSPSKRKRVKKKVWKAQGEVCAECKQPLDLRYSIADRIEAAKGYVADNLQIIHADCDRKRQERKAFS